MIDPMSLTVEALATLVLTKALEKGGETLGEKALEQGGKLIKLLRRKSPETASAIEKVAKQPDLAELEPEEYDQTVLIAKVEQASRGDEEIAEAVRVLGETAREAMRTQPATIQHFAKLAEKIGIYSPNSTINNPTINI